ncbi:MAG TPA: mannose-1-phosphate guanylyltransferase [Lutibacter sp.]|nr:mannose-1-phosphate guanylyltransferase [Lutibacter sp.]
MAGGVGSRFWPVSTPDNPKQFHDMLGTGKTLIQQTFSRLARLIPSENILISTNERYKDLVKKQLPDIADLQLVLEPAMRNTAPAVLFSALKIFAQNPDAQILIAPSDHWIDKENVFIDDLKTAFTACSQHNILMTLGIQPSYPNTGYGYIQFNNSNKKIKQVKQFTEKPNLENAKKFITSGDYLWNAGIFVWSAKSIVKAFQTHLPELFTLFNEGQKVWNTAFEDDFIRDTYPKAKSISIDYGILEKANNVKVLPVDIGWNDLGTWGALYNKLEKKEDENAVVNAKAYFQDASGNMIRTEKGKKVIIKGLKDYIVVENDGVLVILPKNDEQAIKELAKLVSNK